MRFISGCFFVFCATALAFQQPPADLSKQARSELYAGRTEKAVELYRQALAQSQNPDDYYYLTRALLRLHRAKEAYAAADEALMKAPHTAGAETAAGMASFRNGDLTKSEDHFREALRIDSKYPGGLSGLASVYSAISRFGTARDLMRLAYDNAHDDPVFMLSHIGAMKASERIPELERILTLLDPESEDARNLRRRIAYDRALKDRRLRRLTSPYEPETLKLTKVFSGTRLRGYGLRVQLNQKNTVTLLLDTGASGISIAPKMAEKAGLELVTDETGDAKGIGDKKPVESFSYVASEIRIGNVVFAEHPVAAFRTAKDSDIDGLIGADVFARFRVTLDMPGQQLVLTPHPALPPDEPQDSAGVPEGYHRVVRAGTHLMIATSVNESPARWFLIDSGSFSNLIDTERAREFTGVRQDSLTGVRGVQGSVNRVSRADRVMLVFGGFRQENPNLLAISLEKMSDSLGMGVTGVIGMPVIAQLKLSIDYRAGAVRFERP